MARITGIDPVTKGCGGLHNTALLVVQIKRLVPDRRCLKRARAADIQRL
jgi:hypothetical protein